MNERETVRIVHVCHAGPEGEPVWMVTTVPANPSTTEYIDRILKRFGRGDN